MILLDTHAAIMLVLKPEALSGAARRSIARAEAGDGAAIASITLWEIALLIAHGRVVVQGSTETFLKLLVQRPGLFVLDLGPEVAALSCQFPPDFPGDPADRIIAATARAHGLTLVTKDRRMQDCSMLRTVW